MTRDQDGYLELIELDLGRRCVLSVRLRGWHLVWAGIVGRFVFHGHLGRAT